MANLTITAANVKASKTGSIKKDGIAGVTLTAGQVLALDSTTQKLILADANGSADAKSVIGIALNNASLDQPIKYVIFDPNFVVGATLIPGTTYVLSATPGMICPAADVATGDTVTDLGPALTTTTLNLNLTAGGVAP
jgi:hypothetical protein